MSDVTPLSLLKECIVHSRIVCLSVLVMLPSILVMPPNVHREVESLPLQLKHPLCQHLLIQSYGYII